MFILEVFLGFKSKQGDVTVAFLLSDIGKDKKVHVDMPRGFKQYPKNGHEQCFKMKNTFYGIFQRPCAFWKFMKKQLE